MASLSEKVTRQGFILCRNFGLVGSTSIGNYIAEYLQESKIRRLPSPYARVRILFRLFWQSLPTTISVLGPENTSELAL